MDEIRAVYRQHGVRIADKHIAVVVGEMLRRVAITDAGDTALVEGEFIGRHELASINRAVTMRGGKPARYTPALLGVTKVAMASRSFFSAASSREATRVLANAAFRGARDGLLGSKENIIIGHIIPAGTGAYRNHDVVLPIEGAEMSAQVAERSAPLVDALPRLEIDEPTTSDTDEIGDGGTESAEPPLSGSSEPSVGAELHVKPVEDGGGEEEAAKLHLARKLEEIRSILVQIEELKERLKRLTD